MLCCVGLLVLHLLSTYMFLLSALSSSSPLLLSPLLVLLFRLLTGHAFPLPLSIHLYLASSSLIPPHTSPPLHSLRTAPLVPPLSTPPSTALHNHTLYSPAAILTPTHDRHLTAIWTPFSLRRGTHTHTHTHTHTER